MNINILLYIMEILLPANSPSYNYNSPSYNNDNTRMILSNANISELKKHKNMLQYNTVYILSLFLCNKHTQFINISSIMSSIFPTVTQLNINNLLTIKCTNMKFDYFDIYILQNTVNIEFNRSYGHLKQMCTQPIYFEFRTKTRLNVIISIPYDGTEQSFDLDFFQIKTYTSIENISLNYIFTSADVNITPRPKTITTNDPYYINDAIIVTPLYQHSIEKIIYTNFYRSIIPNQKFIYEYHPKHVFESHGTIIRYNINMSLYDIINLTDVNIVDILSFYHSHNMLCKMPILKLSKKLLIGNLVFRIGYIDGICSQLLNSDSNIEIKMVCTKIQTQILRLLKYKHNFQHVLCDETIY